MIKNIYTIGHSTRNIDEFIEILLEFNIQQLIDVRTIPKSRYNLQFNSEDLKSKLKEHNIDYFHLKILGGLRQTKKDSINTGWKNKSFRGFADYMQTKEFAEGIKELILLSSKNNTALMCAESVPWKCHRSLISDALIIKNIKVIHIINKNNIIQHKLTDFAKIKDDKIFYPG